MGKGHYFILAILALSVVGNVVQSYQYHELSKQRDDVYAGVVEHLRATLQRERGVLTDNAEYKTLAARLGVAQDTVAPAAE